MKRRVIGLNRQPTHALLMMIATALVAAPRSLSAQTPEDKAPPSPTSAPAASQPAVTTSDPDTLDDIELLELEVPVVVTATRHEQKLTTLPYAVSVITAAEIRQAGARTVPDALRLIPGVDVAALTGTQHAVSPRGLHALTASQILVLVDGRQIFDAYFGGTTWGAWPFQVEDIARIEVIRGPGGVTWGSNAANGVINIITKDPEDQLGFVSTSGGGSRGNWKQHFGLGHREDQLRFRISGEFEAHDGFVRGGSRLGPLDDDMKTGRASVHAIYDHGPDDTFVFSGGSAVADGGMPPSSLVSLRSRKNSGSEASFVLGKWRHRIAEDNQLEFTAFVNDCAISTGARVMDYRYQQLGFQISHQFKPSAHHTITWGVDSRLDRTDTSNADPYGMTKPYVHGGMIGLYLQDDWRLAPRWLLSLGGRVDYDFYGGFASSARAALAYELTDRDHLYGAVSRSYSGIPAAIRHLDIPVFNGVYHITGDPQHDEQTVISYELGYRGRRFKNLDFNAGLFWYAYDGLGGIPTRLGPPGILRGVVTNVADCSMYGVELDAKYAVTDNLKLLAHYTYQQARWDSSVPYHTTDMIWPPKHKSMVGINYSPLRHLNLGSYLYYVDATEAPDSFGVRPIDPYLRLDLRAEYTFWDERAAVSVGVKNLLDPHHYEGSTAFLNNAEVPRMLYAELRVHFK